MRKKRRFVKFLLILQCIGFLFFLKFVSATGPNLVITLKINNTENYVYIPGRGEISSSNLGSVLESDPPHYYLASYLNNNLYGLVYQQRYPVYISAQSSTNEHTLTLSQEIHNSLSFLVFTKGDWKTIDNKISSIESGTFLTEDIPSFAYGLGVQTLRIILKPSDINLIHRLTLNRGYHKLNVRSTGLNNNNKIGINITKL